MPNQLVQNAKNKIESDYDVYEDKAVFYLAQQLKGESWATKEEAIELAIETIEWFMDFEPDELLEMVEEMEDKVKYAPGQILEDAIRAASEAKADTQWPDYKESLIFLLKVCRELQSLGGDKFFLSQADAGRVIGKKQNRGRIWMNKFVKDGVLEIVEIGKRHRATYYRFIEKE